MKNYFFILLFLFFLNTIIAQNYKFPIGIPHKTRSLGNPIIYENGFKEYFFKDVKIKGYDNHKVELRFDKTNFASYTMKIMFDNFGKWDKKINVRGVNRFGLVWDNISLFKDENIYKIIAFGLETNDKIYSSIVVLDSNGNDCMLENYPDRQKIINFFISKFSKLGESDLFYKVY